MEKSLIRVHGNQQFQLLTTFPDSEIRSGGLEPQLMVINGDVNGMYVEDVATSKDEVFFVRVEVCPLRGGSCTWENSSRIAAVGKDGKNPRVVAKGAGVTHVATDAKWLYYSDMDQVYCQPLGGTASREIISGYGFVSALGVSDTHVYVGVEPARSADIRPSTHRSSLYRIPKPVCQENP